MKLRKLIVVAFTTGTLAVIGCGDGGSNADATERCNVEACINNSELRNTCIREATNCINAGGDPERCIAFGVETCTI